MQILEFHAKLRFVFLPQREGVNDEFFDNVWGRFPPEMRYNMDQVPLPFVVEQERTFTSHDDAHVHIRSCGADGLTKRQYTMHIFVNAGEGQDGVCYVELIARGKGQRLSQVEKAGWHPLVSPVLFQKCAWVDRPTMLIIAKKFCIKKRERHGNRRVLLFADNLDAHCWEEVLNEFARANVLVVFVVPGCTDAIQPIDAGIGRSIRIYIGQELDTWLMINDNLDKWEKGFTASERRVMMTNLLARAVTKVQGDDSLRVKCFERTGCLLRLTADMEHDAKVKPQGLKLPYSIPASLPDHLLHLQQSSRPAEIHVPDETLPSSSIEENETDAIHDNATTDNAVTTVELTSAFVDRCSSLVIEMLGDISDDMIELATYIFTHIEEANQ
jgi:hypothetical protein